jgi:CRP/FNR family cyclic AMP-dependent transcriptional regulator
MSFGYLSFIDGGAMPHDLVAHTPAVALRMPVASVRRLSLVWHELMEAFQMQLAQRLRAVYDALIYNKAFSLRERVVMQVVALADWVGLQRGEHVVIELPMSQTDLADLVGAGRQAVNAELQRLQALGLVRVARAHVDVLDLEGLRANLPSDMPPLQLHLA